MSSFVHIKFSFFTISVLDLSIANYIKLLQCVWLTICVNKQFNIFLLANEKTSYSHNTCIAFHFMQADNFKTNKQTTTSIYEGILS